MAKVTYVAAHTAYTYELVTGVCRKYRKTRELTSQCPDQVVDHPWRGSANGISDTSGIR